MDVEMTSPTTPSTPITIEDRVTLSRLLMDIYMCLDHEAIHSALHTTSSTNIEMADSDLSSTMSTESGEIPEHKDPETLTTQIILASTLQYVQLNLSGSITSRRAQTYSIPELLISLAGFWPPNAKKQWDEMGKLQVCVRMVVEQIERGNSALEPVATLKNEVEIGESSIFYPLPTPPRDQVSTAQEQPAYIKRTPGAISAVYNTPSDSSPSSSSSFYYIPPRTPSGPISIGPETGGDPAYIMRMNMNMGFFEPSPFSLTDSLDNRPPSPAVYSESAGRPASVAPSESNCSMRPESSHRRGNHETWKMHAYRHEKYFFQEPVSESSASMPSVNTVRLVRRPGFVSAVFNDTNLSTTTSCCSSCDSSAISTDFDPVIRTVKKPGSHTAIFNEPKRKHVSSVDSPSSYATSTGSSSGEGKSAASLNSKPRPALGTGGLPSQSSGEVSEAAMVANALDQIEAIIDGWCPKETEDDDVMG